MCWSATFGNHKSIAENGCVLTVFARSPSHTPIRIVHAASELICCLNDVSVPFLPPVTDNPIAGMKALKRSSIPISRRLLAKSLAAGMEQ